MNRIYNLVWNPALRTVQVASELATSTVGGNAAAGTATGRFHRHPLAMACITALALGAFALPAWSENCPAGSTSWSSATGAAGSNATATGANGGDGSPATGSVGSGDYCLPSGNTLSGGNGGIGGTGSTGVGGSTGGTGGTGGSGGYGGNGVAVSGSATNLTLTSSGTITGGAGGSGGTGGTGGSGSIYGGTGGNGGTGSTGGIGVSGNGFTLTNTGTMTGGAGGTGGSGGASGTGYGGNVDIGGNGGNGGNSGPGVSGNGFTLTNGYAGQISGGNGGDGGIWGPGPGSPNLGTGSSGAPGVTGTGFTLSNNGFNNSIIKGGKGGYGLYGGNGGAGVSGTGFSLINSNHNFTKGGDGYPGNGGAGIVSTGNSTVTTSAFIWAGTALASNSLADAVDFSGGGNTLTLESDYSFIGNVVSASGTTNGGDTLALGGDTNDTFDLAQLVGTNPQSYTGVQYFGFNQFTKTGASTWTLTGSDLLSKPWTISDGTLALGSANALTYSNVTNFSTLAFANGVATGNVVGYTQTNTGTLSLNATATTCDTLAASGNASLNGALNVAFAAAPATGFSCTVLTAPAITGTFASVNVTGLSNGQPTSVIYNAGSVVLAIKNSQTIALASACMTSFVAPPAQPFTYSATVNGASPIGSVTFSDGSGTLCSAVALSNGTASCTTEALTNSSGTATTYQLSATYNDGNNPGLTAMPLTVKALSAADVVFRNGFEAQTAACPIE
jgi:hypothetical protein